MPCQDPDNQVFFPTACQCVDIYNNIRLVNELSPGWAFEFSPQGGGGGGQTHHQYLIIYDSLTAGSFSLKALALELKIFFFFFQFLNRAKLTAQLFIKMVDLETAILSKQKSF